MASGRFDQVSNIAFIVMCLAVTVAAGSFVIGRRSPTIPEASEAVPRGTALPVEVTRFINGLPSLLLVLSTTCQFCEASMPFYRELAALNDVQAGRLRIVVISIQPPEQMRAHLDARRLTPSAIVPALDTPLRLEGTPTIILVDRKGVVDSSWKGQLHKTGERAVVQASRRLASSPGYP
jgi:hypothetical protein